MDKQMIGMCGTYCGTCEWKERTNCPGCQKAQSKLFWGQCSVAKCSIEKGYNHCGHCGDLPCEKLQEAFNNKDHGDNGERLINLRNWAREKETYLKLTTLKSEGIIKEKVLGEKLESIEYRERVGAYALIFDENNRIATIKTPRNYFLPGGGVENGESPEECVLRECLEELGYSIKIKELLCKGELYDWAKRVECYMHSIGYFYMVDSFGKVKEPIEEDHELLWLSIDECLEKLCLEHQVWAVEQAKNYMGI